MKCRIGTMLAALVLAPALAHGDEAPGLMSLEGALSVSVEGASRFQQPLSEVPSAVTVISAADIRNFGYRNLAEALQSAPGVYATNDRSYTYLGIRGFGRPGDYNSRILLLTDGLRRNDPIYNQAMVGNEAPIDLDWVKQIEFVPGAASALYGGNALFGIANAVLWSGADLQGSRITTEVGSDGLTHLSLLSGNRIEGGPEWIAGVSLYQMQGGDVRFPEFAVPGVSDGVARGLDGERNLKAFAKLTAGDWQINATYSARRKNVPTAYYGTLFDTPGNYTVDDYAFVDLSQSRELAPEWNQYLRMSLGAYYFNAQFVYAGQNNNRDNLSARWISGEYRLVYTGWRNHRLMMGAEIEVDPRLDQDNYDINPTVVHLQDHRSNQTFGVYAQDEWQLAQRWVANLGLRFDSLRDYDSIASPRAALIYHPDPESSLKLVHGRAFRQPNAYERFYNDGNLSQKANPALIPERIRSTELIAEFPLTHAIHVGGTYYRYRLDHLVDQVTDPMDGLAVFINSPTLHAHGMEFEAEALLRSGVTVKGSFGWADVEQSASTPVNSPQRLAKLMINGPLPELGLNFGLNLQGIGPRTTLGGATVPGYATANLVVTKRLPMHGSEVSLGIYNLAGRRYLDPAPPLMTQDSLPTDDRQVLLRASINF